MGDRSHIEVLSDLAVRHQQAPRGTEPHGTPPSTDRPIAARYRLCARLGRGRLGAIYEALDGEGAAHGIERRVALQLLDESIAADRDFVDDLALGYAALRTARHPGIVGILDFGRAGNVVYLVMEQLEGASLRFVLNEATALSMDETAPLIRAIGDALQYLHVKGLVHGNLCPEQVFVTFDYAVKLLDVVPSSRPSRAPYAVEVRDPGASQTGDARDDIYALACLAYELLTGSHPFNANSPLEAQRARLEPRPIGGLTPRQWQTLVRGLAFERAQRMETVAEFLAGLGVMGTERLPATAADPQQPNPVPAPLPAPRQDAPPAYRPLAQEEVHWQPPPRRRTAPAKSRTARPLLMVVAAAGLGAAVFLNYEPLRIGAADLMARVRARLESLPGTAPGDVGVAGVPFEPPPRAAATPPQPEPAPADALGLTQPPAALDTVTPAVAIPAAGPADPLAAPQDSAAPVAPAATLPQAEPQVNAAPEPAPARQPAGAPDSLATTAAESQFVFDGTVLRVSERAATAAVVIRRTGDISAPASVAWWLSGNTALPDQDFADLGPGTETFGPNEDTLTVLVPLVRDAIAEPPESFYVYIGRYDPQQRHLVAAARLQIDLADDD
jgi:hypothetical protein